jgi:hypothetical protein
LLISLQMPFVSSSISFSRSFAMSPAISVTQAQNVGCVKASGHRHGHAALPGSRKRLADDGPPATRRPDVTGHCVMRLALACLMRRKIAKRPFRTG